MPVRPAVVTAVIFLGDDFGFINAVGLVVLVFGAGLFNYSKYQKMVEKDKSLTRTPGEPPTLNVVQCVGFRSTGDKARHGLRQIYPTCKVGWG